MVFAVATNALSKRKEKHVLNIVIAVKDYTAEQKMMQEHARNFLKKEMNVCQMIMTI